MPVLVCSSNRICNISPILQYRKLAYKFVEFYPIATSLSHQHVVRYIYEYSREEVYVLRACRR